MKLVLALILSFSVVAFADDFNGDPNMDIGLNDVTQASFNDTSNAHQNSQRSYGKTDSASCPYCAEPTSLAGVVEGKTTLYLEKGKVVSETPEAAQSGSPDVDPSKSNQ